MEQSRIDCAFEYLDPHVQARTKLAGDTSVVPVSSLVSFVASYKVRYTKEGKQESMGRYEGAIPPGLTSVVGGESGMVAILETDTLLKQHIVDNFIKTPYFERFRMLVDATMAHVHPELTGQITSQQVRDLLMNGSLNVGGETLTMERNFVFFLYGQCANESMGIDIKNIRVASSGETVDVAEMMPHLTAYNPGLQHRNVNILAIGGQKERTPEPEPEPTPEPEPKDPGETGTLPEEGGDNLLPPTDPKDPDLTPLPPEDGTNPELPSEDPGPGPGPNPGR